MQNRSAVSEGVPPPLSGRSDLQESLLGGSQHLGSQQLGASDLLDGTATAGSASDVWVVTHAKGRSPLHATLSRAELAAALFGGESGGGGNVPLWLRQAIGCAPFFLWELDLY